MKTKDYVLVGLSVVALVLLLWNPFGFGGALQALYSILPLSYIFYNHFTELGKVGVVKSTLAVEDQKAIDAEKIKSTIRMILQVLGVLIAVLTALGLNVPIVSTINKALQSLLSNFDVTAEAIGVIIGTIITLIGYFKDKGRFADRVFGINK